VDGNYQTEVRINFLKEEFAKTGFEQARLRLEWISASEGLKFAQVVTEMVESIRELGPNPLKRMRESVKEKA
jgi:F420-non-reducing hydrogenase iron-sulfur subunit